MGAHPIKLHEAMHSRSMQPCRLLPASRHPINSAQRAGNPGQHPHQPSRCSSLAAAAQPVAQVAESGVLTDVLTMTLAGGIIAGVTLSALPLLSGRAQVGCQQCMFARGTVQAARCRGG